MTPPNFPEYVQGPQNNRISFSLETVLFALLLRFCSWMCQCMCHQSFELYLHHVRTVLGFILSDSLVASLPSNLNVMSSKKELAPS